MTDVEQVPILDFMLVRPASEIDKKTARRKYIHDTVLVKGANAHIDIDLQSPENPSKIGKLIYQRVFCESSGEIQDIFMTVLGILTPLQARCVDTPNYDVQPLDIGDLGRHAYVRVEDTFYLLPDTIASSNAPLARKIAEILPILTNTVNGSDDEFVADKLAGQIRTLFDNRALATVVYDESQYTQDFQLSKRALFDALYILYIMRRWTSVNFEPIMNGLRVLHVLEALAIDELYATGLTGHLNPNDSLILHMLDEEYPGLRGWKGSVAIPEFPLIATRSDLAIYLEARPIVHPMFAQLYHYAQPFNSIRPLGVGDLKVVKQWLVGYQPGEISDIHNVMQGETRDRTHRRLEKTEDTFSYTSTSQQESTKDTQSTDRFEVKREAEQVVKTDLNVNANMRAQYDNKVVLVAVGAGFAYNRSSSDQQKIAQNFSREVVDKAVTRVQTSTVQQRSTTKIFETEETNKQSFTNTNPDKGHISGIYRWVDKQYKAQVFNYGRRMMFEFILPEPAALFVESRLRDFEATINYPEKPVEPTFKTLNLGFSPADITEPKFNELRQKYNLSTTYPLETKTVAFVSQEENGVFFTTEKVSIGNDQWYAKSYVCKLGSEGYQIEKLRITGQIWFQDHNDPPKGETDLNICSLRIDGTTVWYEEHTNRMYVGFGDNYEVTLASPYVLNRDEVDLVFSFQDISRYDLLISGTLKITATKLLKWQTEVWWTIVDIEQKVINATNLELKNGYESDMATYRNRSAEIKATAIRDLIQGQSEAFNKDLIITELRRQCMAMVTKDFDAYVGDDLLTEWESMGTRRVTVGYRHLKVDTTGIETKVEFTTTPHNIDYPVPILNEARDKGRYIQFLEQAFEWGRLGYICYPYFWATPPKWIELMNRTDDSDPNLTAFLRAGAIKVLVAVTPAYDEAVLHFLSTREPWEGGPSPVIDDPLYLPLFEELHKQQDDRYGATPEGDPWAFTLPTSLVYLHGSSTPLPTVPKITP